MELKYNSQIESAGEIKVHGTAENIGSSRVLEKSGMQLVNIEKDGLEVEGKVYDKLIYEYKANVNN